MLNYMIKNATVFDGDSPQPQQLTVGIEKERITYLGEPLSGSAAETVIDGSSLYLCPGFIDTHASTGYGYMLPNAGDNKLLQGVTSEIIGNCGTSPAPVGDLLLEEMDQKSQQIGFAFNWRELGEWFKLVEDYGLPFNSGTYVGHSTLRAGICQDAQQVTRTEIDQMCAMLERAMQDGALGLSTGLVYAPGSFADTGEIIELAKISQKYGGIYVSHIRDERQKLVNSIEEAIEISIKADIPVLVSHLKSAEKPNWGNIPKVIEMIDSARARGAKISFEVYPYPAVSTTLRTFIPKAVLSDGLDGMVARLKTDEWRQRSIKWLESRETDYAAMMLITESMPGVQGKSIQEFAKEHRRAPGEMVVDLLLSDPEAWIVYHCISEADMDAAIMCPYSIVCSDSWSYPVNAPNPIGNPHPRTYGAFTRFLERYALQNQRLSFGEAVRKISGFPADWIDIPHRGRIREGYFADLTLLNPDEVKEKATFKEPRQFSEGTIYCWVNGTLMVQDSQLLEKLPGKIIRRS